MAETAYLINPRRVLIVDDHPVVRFGFAQLISREPDLEVSGEATSIAEALRQAESKQPDVVIVDLTLEGENGIELIEYLKSRWPTIKVLVSSGHDEQTFAGRVLRAGASGYLCKREAMLKIIEALRQVLRGEIYLSPQMATSLLQRAALGKPLNSDPVETLSDRELQVFQMIGQGLNTQQIAHNLMLSPKTVESHRKVIKSKLKVQTAAQLSRAAFQWVQEGH